jgi:hypothetical protein
VTFSRSALALTAAMLVAGCAGKNQLDETGGLKVTRSVCPAVAVAAYTGDVSLFSPAESRDARALDVSATITNLQTVCDQATSPVKANVTFDVVARRASGSGARDIVFPYFATVLRGSNKIVSKQLGNVQVHFAGGAGLPLLRRWIVQRHRFRRRCPSGSIVNGKRRMPMRRSTRWPTRAPALQSAKPVSSF